MMSKSFSRHPVAKRGAAGNAGNDAARQLGVMMDSYLWRPSDVWAAVRLISGWRQNTALPQGLTVSMLYRLWKPAMPVVLSLCRTSPVLSSAAFADAALMCRRESVHIQLVRKQLMAETLRWTLLYAFAMSRSGNRICMTRQGDLRGLSTRLANKNGQTGVSGSISL